MLVLVTHCFHMLTIRLCHLLRDKVESIRIPCFVYWFAKGACLYFSEQIYDVERNLYNMKVPGNRQCVKYIIKIEIIYIVFSWKRVKKYWGLDVIQDRVHLRIFMVIAKGSCIS